MGSAYRLLTVALLALMTIIAFEAMAISTAMPSVARDLDAVRSYGLAFSLMLTAELLGIVLAGVWSDRHGPLSSLFSGPALLPAGSAAAGLPQTFPLPPVGPTAAAPVPRPLPRRLSVVPGPACPRPLRPKRGPRLRRALDTRFERTPVAPDGVPDTDWLAFEQDKHQHLLNR